MSIDATIKLIFINLLCVSTSAVFAFGYLGLGVTDVYADEEIGYCDDADFRGSSEHVQTSYDIYYDDFKITESVSLYSVPSFGNGDPTRPNGCAPITALNILAYYDRWHTDLIPDYDPGMTFASGNYNYYPDLGEASTKSVFRTLYSLMKTGENGTGTSESNFYEGFESYVKSTGHNLRKTSFYKSGTSVDFAKLKEAVDQGKVAMITLTKYNYVYSIMDSETQSKMHVAKIDSPNAHMMMVYGYRTYSYYKNGVNFLNETFLRVCSSFGDAAIGYMKLNDYSSIKDAWIMTID